MLKEFNPGNVTNRTNLLLARGTLTQTFTFYSHAVCSLHEAMRYNKYNLCCS